MSSKEPWKKSAPEGVFLFSNLAPIVIGSSILISLLLPEPVSVSAGFVSPSRYNIQL